MWWRRMSAFAFFFRKMKNIKCHQRANFAIFSPARISHQTRLSGHEFLISWYKICYYTFHLSEFAKQIILRSIRSLLASLTPFALIGCSCMFSTWWKHKENCKKKIQIHNAKRSVLLDKTFCEKRKKTRKTERVRTGEGGNVYNFYYL